MASDNSIKAIDTSSVHRITSGQVVIDLQTAVKELVENSIDAGATSIEVRFKQYGLTSIEVIDNGSGIAPEDYESVALKHHTSKLKVFADLTSLVSFGFRGEALSSLCSLCETVSLTTARTQETPVGTELVFDRNGRIQSKGPVARQRGTTVTLSNIFKPLAVRRKELERNIKREFAKVLNLLNAYALGPCTKQPGVRLTVSNQPDGGKKTVQIRTDGTPSMSATVSALWGPKAMVNIVDLNLKFNVETSKTALKRLGNLEDNGVSAPSSLEVQIKGLTSKFSIGCGRTSTDRQFFYVNGRPCNLSKVQKAFNEVYRSFSVNQSPFLLVDIILPTENCDINVSPDKRTIFIHSEENLVAGLKACLEETFASSRSTFDIKEAQLTQTQLQVHDTQTSQLARRRSRPDPTPPVQDSDMEDEKEDDEFQPRASSAPQKSRTLGRKQSGLQTGISRREQAPRNAVVTDLTSDDEVQGEESFEPGNIFYSQASDSRKLEQDVDEDGDCPSCTPQRSQAPEALFLEDLDADQDNDGDVLPPVVSFSDADVSMDVDSSDVIDASSFIGASSSLSLAHRPSTPPTSELSSSHHNDSMQEGDTVPSSVIQIPLSTWALRKTLSSSVSRGSGTAQKRKEPVQTTLNTSSTSWSRQLKASQHPAESEEPEERVSPPRKRYRSTVADSPLAHQSSHERSHSLSGSRAPPQRKSRSSSTSEHSEPVSDSMDVDTPSAPADVEQHQVIELSASALDEDDPVERDSASKHAVEFVRTVTDDDQVTLRFNFDRLSEIYANNALALELHCSQTDGEILDVVVPADAGVTNTEDNDKAADALSRIIDKKDFETMEILGQFNRGFVIVRRRKRSDDDDLVDAMDDLFIVDQHAADEKYNFETLQQTTIIRSQKLYKPLPLELAAADELLALDRLEILKQNGFELEADEERSVGQKLLVTAQPVSKTTDFDMKDLEELVSLLHGTPAGRMVRCSKARAMFAMRACRKSVMIGTPLNTSQMTSIVRHMGTMDQPWNCPHGRPTMRHLSNISNFGQGISRFKARRVDWDKLPIPLD
jgi:DNA mismatch repair protein PMS2